MKVKYLAALAATSVFGMATLTSCGPSTTDTEPDASGEIAPDAAAPDTTAAPDAMAAPDTTATPDAMAEPDKAAEPCAAK